MDAIIGRGVDWGDFELTPRVEAAINGLARRGRADPAARNDLFFALQFKIARFVARRRRWCGPLLDHDDLEQEAFVVFAGLVADWDGRGSFARWFLVSFPWRLRRALEWHHRRWGRVRLVPGAYGGSSPDVDLGLGALYGPFDPEEERLLTLHLVDGWRLEEVAPLLGWSRRTAFRRWAAVRERLAAGMAA